MKMYIPEIKDKIKLTAPWTFDLWPDYRNISFARSFTGKDYNQGFAVKYSNMWVITDGNYKDLIAPKEKLIITFKEGTILSVDRVYIRKGSADYSSISFFDRTTGHGRFWAKLADCNNIEFEKV